jgi:prophage tail gpP-like protein
MALDNIYEVPGVLQDTETRAILKVNGRAFNTWKSITIERSITQLAGSFSFVTANRFAGENEKWNITTGDECSVSIGDETIITGYIDDVDDGYDLDSHDVTFNGRDKTADLIDCPYDVFANVSELHNQTFLQIIEKLCSQSSINVILDSALSSETALTTVIPVYNIETGTMIYEQISTLCLQYGVLSITDGNGNIKITRSGLTKAYDILQSGVNIKANRLNQSDADRYSVYYAEGPSKSTAFTNKLISEGKLEDNYIKRNRPFIILVGEQATGDTCQKRAAWEARIKAGVSRKVSTQVKGWVQTNKKLWPLNGLVQVVDKKIGINEELLIASINLSLDSTGGEVSNLALVHPDTFVLQQNTPINSKDGLNAFGRPLKK